MPIIYPIVYQMCNLFFVNISYRKRTIIQFIGHQPAFLKAIWRLIIAIFAIPNKPSPYKRIK